MTVSIALRTSAACLGMMLYGAAVGADPPQKAGAKLATRDELRQCMSTSDALQARRAAMDKQLTEHQAAMKALQADSDTLQKAQRAASTQDEKQVQAFNAQVDAFNARTRVLNQQADDYNAQEAALVADMRAHNTQCASRPFKVSDREAILKERQAQQR
jgi:hypothetical protein